MKVQLDDICQRIYAGGDVPKDRFSPVMTSKFSVPIFANAEKDNGLYGYTDIAREYDPCVTVAARGTIGFTAIRNEPFLPVVRLITVVPDRSIVTLKFLCYALRSYKPKSSGTSIPQLTVPELKRHSITLYSIEKQNTITHILDSVSQIIVDRQKEINALDDLIKARFVEMFGDPMVNSKGYQLKMYGDLFELNAGGTPSKANPEYWEGGTISWIGSNMCQNEYIYENDGHFITVEGLNHSSAKMFPIDTVLVALVGATIGKTALLKFETTTNQNVLGIRGIRENGYTPEFVYYYTQGLYKMFLGLADGGFAMASKGFISELPIPLVDKREQESFTLFANQIDKSKSVIQKSLDETQLLFDSLMQEYFG